MIPTEGGTLIKFAMHAICKNEENETENAILHFN
jgi:hypothetical protein